MLHFNLLFNSTFGILASDPIEAGSAAIDRRYFPNEFHYFLGIHGQVRLFARFVTRKVPYYVINFQSESGKLKTKESNTGVRRNLFKTKKKNIFVVYEPTKVYFFGDGRKKVHRYPFLNLIWNCFLLSRGTS